MATSKRNDERVRVNLFFDPDHPVAQIPTKDRAAFTRNLINFALSFQNDIYSIERRLERIEASITTAGLAQDVTERRQSAWLKEKTLREEPMNERLHNELMAFYE